MVTSKTKVVYESQESSEKLSLHKLSSVFKRKPALVVYTDIFRVSEDSDKFYMKNCSVIESTQWLQQLCSPILLTYSKPLIEGLPSNDLKLAKTMARNLKTTLVSYKNQTLVFAQVFYGLHKWRLGVT